jgi:crossover junction endodeoxyribonuclease RusA
VAKPLRRRGVGEVRVTLPWPPAELSPNSRPHWAAKSRAAKSYRHACATLARQAGVLSLPDGRLHVTVEFVPPDRRHRDRDNMLASIKSGLDGLADALGVNDSRFDLTIRVADEVGGMVRVSVSHGTAP